MKKKLTLTIEASVKRRAKRLAKRSDTSISAMVENFLKMKTDYDEWQPEEGSWTQEMLGSMQLPEELKHMNYKQIKENELQKKYVAKNTD